MNDTLVVENGTVKFRETDPGMFRTPADRYLCLLLQFDEQYETPDGKTIYLPSANDEEAKKKLGWKAGKIMVVGGLDVKALPQMDAVSESLADKWGHRLENNTWVPMFYDVGDIVVCERLGGRHIQMKNREFFLINQVDVLGQLR